MRVLVVEDSAEMRHLIAIMLGRNGHEVAEAVDGADALNQVQVSVPDVILLDLSMPRMDGLQFAAAYRHLPGPTVPIVVMSSPERVVDGASATGAAGYVVKPFDMPTLLAALDALVRVNA